MLLSLGRRTVTEDLVALLLECHGRIRSFVALASEVGRRVDLPDDEVRGACLRCERYFTLALPLHVRDEEESLVPRLRGASAEVDEALAAMHRQHGEHEAPLRALLETLQALAAAPGDRGLRSRLHDEAAALGWAFEEHLAAEERVLFPLIQARWSRATQAQVLAELRARRA
jgi:hemerythrin-like domain-containing protein